LLFSSRRRHTRSKRDWSSDVYSSDLLLLQHINQLINRETIEIPTYDYANHTRSDQTITVEPKEVIIIEGIFALENEALRNIMDVKLYVDTDSDIRLLRRISRDVKERG